MILNERWVLTSTSVVDNVGRITSIKVVAGDRNFDEKNRNIIEKKYRQVVMSTQQERVGNLYLLHLSAKLILDNVNVAKVQLPMTFVQGTERSFKYGYPEVATKCQVFGWIKENTMQIVGKVRIKEGCRHDVNRDAHVCVKTSGNTFSWFAPSKCAGNDRCLKNIGNPLVCRINKNDPWILIGVGDHRDVWEAGDMYHFARVSPYIGQLRRHMTAKTPDLYMNQGVEGQEKKFSFQAFVKVAYVNGGLNYKCQGAIIGRRAILTAASCFDQSENKEVERVSVVVGVLNLNEATERDEKAALNWHVYDENAPRKYDPNSNFDFYNVGVIILRENLEYNDNVRTISLPQQSKQFLHSDNRLSGCTVSGWEEKPSGNVLARSGQYHPELR